MRQRRWQAHGLVLLVSLLAALPVVAFKAQDNRQLSLVDELQYADRVHEVTTGDFVMYDGETVGAWANGVLSCRGIVRLGPEHPERCGAPHAETAMSNPAAADPPTYFWATGALAKVAMTLGVTDSPLLAGRLVGAVWAALSMWLVLLLARALGAGWVGSGLAAATVLLVPAFSQNYAYITPHSLAIAVGAFTAIATVKLLRGEWRAWPLAAAGLLVAGVKGTNLTITAAMGLTMLAVLAWPGQFNRATRMRALTGGVVLGGSTLAFTFLWQLYLDATRVTEQPPPGDYLVESLDVPRLIRESATFISGFGEGPLLLPGAVLMLAMTGTALATWAGLTRTEPLLRTLGAGYVLGAMVAPMLLMLPVYVATDQYIGVAVRYGLALWPVGLAFAALLVRTRLAAALAAAFLVTYAALPYLLELDGIAY